MTRVILRIFPSNRRGSFMSIELELGTNPAIAETIFKLCNEISPKTHKLARGITYISDKEPLINGETINIMPM